MVYYGLTTYKSTSNNELTTLKSEILEKETYVIDPGSVDFLHDGCRAFDDEVEQRLLRSLAVVLYSATLAEAEERWASRRSDPCVPL